MPDDFKKVVNSFKIKKTLNPRIWEKDGHLKPEVRTTLLKAAKSYINSWPLTKIPPILDVRFYGSNASFNWSEYSDIDLHILIRYTDVDKDRDLVEKFFTLVKFRWNTTHDIKVGPYDVETYTEDVDNTPISNGVYSIKDDKWLKKPHPINPQFDMRAVVVKAKYFIRMYHILLDMYKSGKRDSVVRAIKALKEKIAKMRKSGLASGGEFSVENIVFKVLRRLDTIGKMDKLSIMASDKGAMGEGVTHDNRNKK